MPLRSSGRQGGSAAKGLLESLALGNADCDWDRFNPDWYVSHNYEVLSDDDREILQTVRDFFGAALEGQRIQRAIDVGAGPNIYPALAMLPFSNEIILREHGLANVLWLNRQVKDYSPTWDRYWDILAARRAYDQVEDPRAELRERARVVKGNLFHLGRAESQLGTMFFVAESISEKRNEFKLAVHRFIGSLTAGAPFAAAFMENSKGYDVGSVRFPAVAVTRTDVEHCLSPLAHDLKIHSISREGHRRDGYTGMILALGRAGHTVR